MHKINERCAINKQKENFLLFVYPEKLIKSSYTSSFVRQHACGSINKLLLRDDNAMCRLVCFPLAVYMSVDGR